MLTSPSRLFQVSFVNRKAVAPGFRLPVDTHKRCVVAACWALRAPTHAAWMRAAFVDRTRRRSGPAAGRLARIEPRARGSRGRPRGPRTPVSLRGCRRLVPPIRHRQPAVSAEGLAAHLRARRVLAPLVLGAVDQACHATDRSRVEPRGDEVLGHARPGAVMDGQLDDVLDALWAAREAEQLEALELGS